MITDCLLLWINLAFYERLQNETHWPILSGPAPLTRNSHDEEVNNEEDYFADA